MQVVDETPKTENFDVNPPVSNDLVKEDTTESKNFIVFFSYEFKVKN